MAIDLETCFEKVTRLEGRVDEHENLFETMHGRFDNMERHVEERFSSLEKHFEGRFSSLERHVDGRFNSVEKRIAIIEDRLNHTDAKIDSFQNNNIRFFTWIIGILLTSWLSILLTILYRT